MLNLDPAFRITGGIAGFTPHTAIKLEVMTGPNDVSGVHLAINSDTGKFVAGPVVPGSYLLRATQGTSTAEAEITVKSEDPTGATLSLLPPVDIALTTRFTNSAPETQEGQLRNICNPSLQPLGQSAILGNFFARPTASEGIACDQGSASRQLLRDVPVRGSASGVRDVRLAGPGNESSHNVIAPGITPPPIETVAMWGGGNIIGTLKDTKQALVSLVPQFPEPRGCAGVERVFRSRKPWCSQVLLCRPCPGILVRVRLRKVRHRVPQSRVPAHSSRRNPDSDRRRRPEGIDHRQGDPVTRLASCLLLIAAACPAADLYHVAGTVINAKTNQPLPHAQVYLHKSDTPTPRAPVISGIDGKFNFDLPEGAYLLRAGTRNLIESYGEQGQQNGFNSGVIVGPSRDTSNLVFLWYPPAAIAGRIVDESGDPAEGILVQLVRSYITAGRRVTRVWGWAHTNDRGEYRFGSLAGAGQYYLAATGSPWYEAPNFSLRGAQDSKPSVAFLPVYYPNTSDPGRAAPIVVASGEEARADFALTPAAGAKVSVNVTGAGDFTGTLSLTRDGISGVESFQVSQNLRLYPGVRQQSPQTISSVPPGHYVVLANGTSGGAYLGGRTAVDVNGLDASVDVLLQPISTLTGTLQFADPSMKPRGTVFMYLALDAGGTYASVSVKPDGAFAFPTVGLGSFRIGVGGMPGFVSKIEVTGADYRNGLLTVTENETIRAAITFSTETGNVTGFAMNGDKPAPAVLVVFAPAEESRNPSKYRGYQTESDGSFTWNNLPAGDYNAFAVEDAAFEYANPDVVRPYLATAKKITLAPHQILTDQRISVVPAK